MGKIKKILENELAGGTQTTDVYPVTSTKAVYDANNKRLDEILVGLVAKADILDTTGSAMDKVMSQKAVTDNLALKANTDDVYTKAQADAADHHIEMMEGQNKYHRL